VSRGHALEDPHDHRTGARRVVALVVAVVAVVAVVTVVTVVTGSVVPAGAAAAGARGATLSIAPSTGLLDGAAVSAVVFGVSPGSVYVVAECDPSAFALLAAHASPSDACDSRHATVVTTDAGGSAATVLHVPTVLTTSLGPADCRKVQCFVAAESQYSPGSAPLLVHNVSFSPTACAARNACGTPDDAWDPTLDPPSAPSSVAPAPRSDRSAHPARTTTATPGHPVTVDETAGLARDLTGTGSVTGPYRSRFSAPVVPGRATAGEGLLRLALAAPRTSWAGPHPASTVVDVTVTDRTTATVVGTQQFVLYWGSSTFTYGGFIGPATTADAYRVTVAAEAAASSGGLSWPLGSATPTATVVDSQLEVVDPSNAQYLATTYAPVLFGRSTSALHDVPMLVDATATPVGGGATDLSYTVIWSHEDAGTGFVPFLEWGTWGRMTDIETAISFTVAADGSVSNASYLWGGEPATGFPDSQGALQEVDQPFTGTWDGTHPVLRDATGNNDFSVQGTTPFRFQLAPVPGPTPGQTRESVMDAHPFTYRVSGEEVLRWYGDVSTDPRSPGPGDARQYATVDLDASGTGVSSLAVELRLSGGPTWYASDFHTGYPAHGTGHFRTVVKLPLGWQTRSVTGVRVQAYPSAAAPTVVVKGLRVLRLQPDWRLGTVRVPVPRVVRGATDIPVALATAVVSGTRLTRGPGRSIAPIEVRVTDAVGAPMAGVPVTFTAGPGGAVFDACGCGTVTVTSSAKGLAVSSHVSAPEAAGRSVITATTPDGAAVPATVTLTVT